MAGVESGGVEQLEEQLEVATEDGVVLGTGVRLMAEEERGV